MLFVEPCIYTDTYNNILKNALVPKIPKLSENNVV